MSLPASAESSGGAAGDVRTQSLRFLLVGIGTLLLDYACYRSALLAGMDISPAKTVGFLVGTTAAYLVNRAWTFRSRAGARSVLAFVVLYSVTLVLNVSTNAVLVRLLEGTPFRIEVAFLVAQAITSVANFLGLRWIVFRH